MCQWQDHHHAPSAEMHVEHSLLLAGEFAIIMRSSIIVPALSRCWSGQSCCHCLHWQTRDGRRLTGMSTSTCSRLQLHNWGDGSRPLSDKADKRGEAISLLLHGTGQAGQSKLGVSMAAVYAGMDLLTGMVSEQTRMAQHNIEVRSPQESRGQAVCKQ